MTETSAIRLTPPASMLSRELSFKERITNAASLAVPSFRNITRSFSSSAVRSRSQTPEGEKAPVVEQPASSTSFGSSPADSEELKAPVRLHHRPTGKPVVRTCSEKAHHIRGARREQQDAFLELMMGDTRLGMDVSEGTAKPNRKCKTAFRFTKVGRFTARRAKRTCSTIAA